MPRKTPGESNAPAVPSDLSDSERDLLIHVQDSYELETDSFGGDVLLRRPKDEKAIRPPSATRNTIEALQKRGLIAPAKADDPLRIAWRLNKSRDRKSDG